MIIMTFISPFYRDLVWRKYIAEKSLSVKDVLPNLAVDSRVYVNLMLNPMKNRIKNEVMRLLINPGLASKYWIHKGTIKVINSRETNGNPVAISKLEDVKVLADEWTQLEGRGTRD
jgi:hypothetical protein